MPPYLILLNVINANVMIAQPSVVFRSAVVERIQNRLASEPNSELIISVIMYGEKCLTAFTHRAFDQTVDHQHRLFGQCLLAFWDLLHAVC